MTLTGTHEKSGMIEITDCSDEGGSVVRCYPDGRIELFHVPHRGWAERPHGNYPTICAAFAEGEKWKWVYPAEKVK